MERRIIVSASLGHGLTHSLELTFAALLAYVGLEFDADLALLGTIVTAGTFTFGAAAIPSGLVTDRVGPRAVIAGCMAVASVLAFAVAASPNLLMLTISLSALGAAIGFYHPAGTSMVSTIQARRGMAFASHGIAGNAGVALVPAVATGMAVAIDWRAAYVLLGFLAMAVAAAAWRIAPSRAEAAKLAALAASRPSGGRTGTTPPAVRQWFARPLLLVFAISVGMGFIYRGALTFMATHIERNIGFDLLGWSPEAVAGTLTTLVLLFAFVGQLLGGLLSDRMPVERAAVPLTLLSCPFLALAGAAGGVALLVALALFVIMNFAQQPVINGLIADYAPDGRRGAAFGVSFFMTFGVGSIAGTAAGLVAERAGTDATFYLLSAVAGVLAVTAILVSRGAQERRRKLALARAS